MLIVSKVQNIFGKNYTEYSPCVDLNQESGVLAKNQQENNEFGVFAGKNLKNVDA